MSWIILASKGMVTPAGLGEFETTDDLDDWEFAFRASNRDGTVIFTGVSTEMEKAIDAIALCFIGTSRQVSFTRRNLDAVGELSHG